MKKFQNNAFKEVLMRTYWCKIGEVVKEGDTEWGISEEDLYERAIQIANQHQTEALTRRVK